MVRYFVWWNRQQSSITVSSVISLRLFCDHQVRHIFWMAAFTKCDIDASRYCFFRHAWYHALDYWTPTVLRFVFNFSVHQVWCRCSTKCNCTLCFWSRRSPRMILQHGTNYDAPQVRYRCTWVLAHLLVRFVFVLQRSPSAILLHGMDWSVHELWYYCAGGLKHTCLCMVCVLIVVLTKCDLAALDDRTL